MSLQRLVIQNFRNLDALSLNLHPQFNIFYGNNGSGKTSLLEAIYFLGLGRSFRSHLIKNVIQEGRLSCSVFGNSLLPSNINFPIAIEKDRHSKTTIKINGTIETATAELAKVLPLQLINQDSFYLLAGGPKHRRQFLDWGVFHVEPSFYHCWQRLQRSLKQRNAALKLGAADAEIKLWDKELSTAGQAIARLRECYIENLQPIFLSTLKMLGSPYEITLSYQQGWDTEQELINMLDRSLNRDRILGHTQYGPHRADLRIRINNIPAQDILSRGEQKIAVCALRLSQGLLLQQLTDKKCVYLIDDLPAELDNHHRQMVLNILIQLNSQVFITCIELEALSYLGKLPHQVFHVEQGHIEAIQE